MNNNDQDQDKLAQKYDMLANKFKELYQAGKDHSSESMSVALEKAREQLTALGEFSAEQGEELKQYLSRDLEQTMLDAQRMGEEAKVKLNPARLGAGALASIGSILELSGNALRSLSDKTKETLSYKTGEMTSAGTLTCQACHQKIQIKKTGRVPPCPKCSSTLFSKSY